MRGDLSLTVGWLVVNLALGWCAAFPLAAAVALSAYVQARFWGRGAAPFDDLDATIATVFLVAGALFVAGAFVALNRALRRGRRGSGAAFWLGALVLLLVPFAWFMAFTDRTVPVLLGRGLLW